MEFRVTEDGVLQNIYSDEAAEIVNELGVVDVQRLSDVEFEDGGWTVRSHTRRELALREQCGLIGLSTEGELVKFKTRAEALENEIAVVWEILDAK